jgi:hypothetical protein
VEALKFGPYISEEKEEWNFFGLRTGKQDGGNCVMMRQIICIIHLMWGGIA